MDEDTDQPTIHADLALDLKIIASVILFGGHYAGSFPGHDSPDHDSLIKALREWAMEHPFQLNPYAEPETSSALIFMIASRFGDHSTLELPIRFFESLDIMATEHISDDIYLRCSRIDTLIASPHWEARNGPILRWMDIHQLHLYLQQYQDQYPPHPAAEAFRRTMQLVALHILILLAFNDVKICRVLARIKDDMFFEERRMEPRDREITHLVEAAASSGAEAETLWKFYGLLLEHLRGPDSFSISSR